MDDLIQQQILDKENLVYHKYLLKSNKIDKLKSWPGLICHTSHQYSDDYFDDNYYIAFRKPHISYRTSRPSEIDNNDEQSNKQIINEERKKRSFEEANIS